MLYPAELRGLLACDTPSTLTARALSPCLSKFAVRIQTQAFSDAAEHVAVLYRGVGEELRNLGSDDRHGRAAAGQKHGLNRASIQSGIGSRLGNCLFNAGQAGDYRRFKAVTIDRNRKTRFYVLQIDIRVRHFTQCDFCSFHQIDNAVSLLMVDDMDEPINKILARGVIADRAQY
jgi:hypothetical protein